MPLGAETVISDDIRTRFPINTKQTGEPKVAETEFTVHGIVPVPNENYFGK